MCWQIVAANESVVKWFSGWSTVDFLLTASLLLCPGALLTVVRFSFLSLYKHHGEALQGFWFLLLLCHCHITLDRYRKAATASCFHNLIFSFFLKFDFGFEAGARRRSWRESACQGKSLLHGKNSPGITPHLQRCGSGTRRSKIGRQNSEKLILI